MKNDITILETTLDNRDAGLYKLRSVLKAIIELLLEGKELDHEQLKMVYNIDLADELMQNPNPKELQYDYKQLKKTFEKKIVWQGVEEYRLWLDTQGISQKELADAIGKSHAHMNKVLAGKYPVSDLIKTRLLNFRYENRK